MAFKSALTPRPSREATETSAPTGIAAPAGSGARVAAGAGLRIEELAKRYRGASAPTLAHISLEIAPGDFAVVLGPSGCGKTTLLRIVAGLLNPEGGAVRLGDQVWVDAERRRFVPSNHRDLGIVFQNYALWPHLTVAKNVLFPLNARHSQLTRAERKQRVYEQLELVRCADLAGRYPAQLSGGQQQRVALARALVSKPGLLLFDEPLSNLDVRLRIDLRDEIARLHSELRFTALFVTHDQDEALSLADRIVVMRGGRIEQAGTPTQLLDSPETAYVADFFGYTNGLDGHAVRALNPSAAGQALVRPADTWALPRGGADPERELGISEEIVELGPGTVERIARGAAGLHYRVDTGRGVLSASPPRGDATAALAVGDEVRLFARRSGVRFFPATPATDAQGPSTN